MLSCFWETYREQHPSHCVFQMEAEAKLRLSHTIPLMLHGDGGRTLKKEPLEILSLVAPLGVDQELPGPMVGKCQQNVSYSCIRGLRDPLRQRLNNKNSSYLSHFLCFAFPRKKYKKTPGLLKAMLAVISEDLGRCCHEGLEVKKVRWHFGVLGLRGDAEWHASTGVLSRSYKNIGHVNELECCHECMAGGPLLPFEDYGQHAAWKDSVGRLPPWSEQPPYAPIPFELRGWDCGHAACFFRRDPLHVFRLGVGRHFLGSSIVMLCLDGFFDCPNDLVGIDERLKRAWSSFLLFCETYGKSPASMRSFSRQKLHMPKLTDFPWLGCKGSDTMLVFDWLDWFVGLQIISGHDARELRLVKTGCEQAFAFQGIHRHGIWLVRGCQKTLRHAVNGFCGTYARLAAACLQQERTLFCQVSKAHSYHHFAYDLEVAMNKGQRYALNPGLWDASASEDFIGRVSRQSRRVDYRNIVCNTLLAYKVKTKLVVSRFTKARGIQA